VVVWNSSNVEVSDVLRDADVALYEAKRLGKGRHFVYVPGMHHLAVNRFSIVQELRQAVASGDLAMHYQPIVRLSTNEVVGFEALMRWYHAERVGYRPVTSYRSPKGATSSWNSVRSLSTSRFSRRANGTLQGLTLRALCLSQPFGASVPRPGPAGPGEKELDLCSLPADRLILEITEGVALIEVADTLQMIEQLTTLGIGVALDDFGTGFSSLSYLALLNPMIIKVDQSFVRRRSPASTATDYSRPLCRSDTTSE